MQFAPVEVGALTRAISRAIALHGERKTWRTIQKRGMKADVSWAKSAARYVSLYRGLAGAA
jgi:starch synthase